MPNNTTNILSVHGEPEDIQKVKKLLLNEDGEVDFEKVVPMPEDLDITDGLAGEAAYALLYGGDSEWTKYLDYSWIKEEGIKTREQLIEFFEDKFSSVSLNEKESISWRELGKRYHDNLKNYGYTTWYGWRKANWGIKWNAYETEILRDDEDVFEVGFTTAWSAPIPIYEALQAQVPEANIHAYWSDEGSYERICVFP